MVKIQEKWKFLLISKTAMMTIAIVGSVAGTGPDKMAFEGKQLFTKMMQDYDADLRPEGVNGTGPTIVNVNLFVRKIMEISSKTMKYGMQLTFRTQWIDPRLKYEPMSNDTPYITVPMSKSYSLWQPDLFFSNELEAKLHNIMLLNEYFRISPNGGVLHSMRITLTLSCPMILLRYPFDRQTCSCRMASYGSTNKDIEFRWQGRDEGSSPVQVTADLHLPGFALDQFTTDYCDSMTITGTYSCLRLDLGFSRESATLVRKYFVPTALATCVAWTSSWLHPIRGAVPRVIILAGATLYSAQIMGESGQEYVWISYSTMMDCWNGWIWTFLLGAGLEFVIVSYFANNGAEESEAKTAENKPVWIKTTKCWAWLGKMHLQGVAEKMGKMQKYEMVEIFYRILFLAVFLIFLVTYKCRVDWKEENGE